MKKLAIVISHPIQYYAPLFIMMAKSCTLKVFYTLGHSINNEGITDEGFRKIITWDIPLLTGYDYEIVNNTAKKPGHHFNGIKNPDLISSLSLFQPDAILVYGWSYSSHLKVLRHFKGKIPVWFRGDSNLLDHKSNIKSMLRKLLLKWVYSYVDKAFYVGTANKEYFLTYGLKQKQLVFAPHSIDNERFSENRKSEADALRTNLNISKDEKLILFAGKFETKKSPDTLLNAFIALNPPATHLLFVGNGLLEQELKSVVKNLKTGNPALAGCIHFIDFQNQTQMPVLYQACNLFCLPSQGPNETWGLAVNEAMAAGKAILVSDKVGCAADLVKNYINGFIFKSGDDLDLKTKLSLLLNQADLNEFGKKSQSTITSWGFDAQCKMILNQLNGPGI